MRYQFIALLVAMFCLTFCCVAQSEDRWGNWHSDRVKELDSITQLPPLEQLPLLGKLVGIPYPHKKSKLNPYRLDIYSRARSAILSIPGHADYYASRIKQLRDQHDALSDETQQARERKNHLKHELLREQREGFETLQQLPSPETVRVLGEFLTDERGRTIVDPDGPGGPLGQVSMSLQRPNSVYAANALAELPLRNKPHAPRSYADDNQMPQEWINWYTQIKEGRRTFSFEGDPNEYDLNGIVREVKNPDIPRIAKRPEANTEASPTSGKSSPSVSASWIAGAIAALLAIAGWLFVRRKQTA